MTVLEKIKLPGFWTNVFKVAFPFFIVVVLISLFMNSWEAIFAGNLEAVSETNFSNGKWQRFFGFKIAISFLYAFYITTKKTT